MFKTYHVTSDSRHVLENNAKTHNKFYLTHDKLQNFHLRLVQRNYTYDSATAKYTMKDTPYEIPEGNIWLIRFALQRIK